MLSSVPVYFYGDHEYHPENDDSGFVPDRYGGGEENRTPVRRFSCMVFSERRQGFDIPSGLRPLPGLGLQ